MLKSSMTVMIQVYRLGRRKLPKIDLLMDLILIYKDLTLMAREDDQS